MRAFERLEEWPCEFCCEVTRPLPFYDPRNAGAPADAVCAAEVCPVDEEVLRELQDRQMPVFAEFLRGHIELRPVRHRQEALAEFSEALADYLVATYADARVPHIAIRLRLLELSRLSKIGAAA